ncbi:MAG: hypothetical protein RIT81_32280 [Deltaproteobacteria bacterium]
MLTPLDLQAEPYVATGNIASEGMRNQLGRPRIDRLALLVRESAQNAWDAKAPESTFVRFGVTGRDLSDGQQRLLREIVFRNAPPREAVATTEVDALGQVVRHPTDVLSPKSTTQMLFVFDRGTTGLGGPTRADEFSSTEEPRDFVDFFRNMGTPPDTAQGGGTFGYGKAALYLASSAQTILVHTRARVRGMLESRFMVSALTNHYAHEGRLHTGRHWWGRKSLDGIVDPVRGKEADEIARAFGFPEMASNERGTTIGILAPDFTMWKGGAAEAIEYSTWQIVHNFWPKMIAWPNEPSPRMSFVSGWNDKAEPVPDPREFHPYAAFVRALEDVRKSETESQDDEKVFCLRPKKLLGRVALVRCITQESPLVRWSDWESVGSISQRVHHVALLRRPELVVNYLPGPPLPSDDIGYAGVFLADSELDRVYAGAEPPTHDAWNHEILNDKSAKTLVRTTFKRLRERVAAFVRPFETGPSRQKEGAKLTRIADRLGNVLIAVNGDGPSIQPISDSPGKGRGGGKRAKRGSARLHKKSYLRSRDGRLVREFGFEITHADGRATTRVRAEPASALLGGGVEREPPVGAETVTVIGWTSPSGREWPEGEVLDVDEEGVWMVSVSVPADAAISMRVTVEPEKGT